MSSILHTFHAATGEGRGLHACTTAEGNDALALSNAIKLRAAIGGVLDWSDTILEGVENCNGPRVAEAVRVALNKLDAVYSEAGGRKS